MHRKSYTRWLLAFRMASRTTRGTSARVRSYRVARLPSNELGTSNSRSEESRCRNLKRKGSSGKSRVRGACIMQSASHTLCQVQGKSEVSLIIGWERRGLRTDTVWSISGGERIHDASGHNIQVFSKVPAFQGSLPESSEAHRKTHHDMSSLTYPQGPEGSP